MNSKIDNEKPDDKIAAFRKVAAKKTKDACGDRGKGQIILKYVPECRAHIIPLTIIVFDRDPAKDKERPIDKHFHKKLFFQSQGILDSVISGCLQWQETGLAPPPIIIDATKNYWSAENLVGRFISECCYEDPDVETSAKALYGSFRHWWEFNIKAPGREVLSQKKFGSMMVLKYKHKKSGVYRYFGIGINNDQYNLDD